MQPPTVRLICARRSRVCVPLARGRSKAGWAQAVMRDRGDCLRSLRFVAGIALSLALLATSCGSPSSTSSGGAPTLAWYIFPEPSGAFATAASQCSKASNGEYRIQIHALPTAADGQRQEMVRRLAVNDRALDILGLDVTWTAEFAEARWLA